MRTAARLLPILALGVVAVACGSDDSTGSATTTPPPPSTTTDSTPSTPAATRAGYLTSVCPNPIKIQLQWYPQPDPYAMSFGLISDGALDTAAASYTGAAVADPDQTIEIIGGGPLVGYQTTSSLLYANPDILLGDMNMDESISQSKNFPTVGVVAPFVTSPQALMFNPDAVHPETMQDIKESGTTVLVTPSATFAKAMIRLGLLDESQVDFSFDFGPARFVDANGDIAQQSFVTHDPYEYLHSSYWGKPVDQVLIADSYPMYQNTLVVTPDKLDTEADCLARLVPLMQQSMIDYFDDPAPTNQLLAQLSTELSNPAMITEESLQFATDTMRSEGLVGNTAGSDTFGSFDMDRVEQLVGIVAPLFEGEANFDPSVTPERLATNQFIDPSIGFAE